MTGPPVTSFEAIRLIRQGYREGALYAVILVAVVSALILRSVRGTLLALVPVALGVGWTLGLMGALDLPFTFGTLDAPGMRDFAGDGPDARALSAHLMDAWCAFARGGAPAHDGIGDWPAYGRERRSTMELGARCGLREAPREAERVAMETLRGA